MDIKSKNRHKLAVAVIILTLAAAAVDLISMYHVYDQMMQEGKEESERSLLLSEDFLEQFIQASWVIYDEEEAEDKETTGYAGLELPYSAPEIAEEYDRFYPYAEYVMENEDGHILAQSTQDMGTDVMKQGFSDYVLVLNLSYDQEGQADVTVRKGPYRADLGREFRKLIHEMETDEYWQEVQAFCPSDREFTFAMTEDNLWSYLNQYFHIGDGGLPDDAVFRILILTLLTAAAACLYPLVKSFHTGEEKIFQAPLEFVFIGAAVVIAAVWMSAGWMIRDSGGMADILDFFVWFAYFALVYWTVENLRHIFLLGPRKYVRESSLLVSRKNDIKKETDKLWSAVVEWKNQILASLAELKLSDVDNKVLLKAVGVNFVFLGLITCLWYFGLILLVLYSVGLFYFLLKSFKDVKGKYDRLLAATNAIADGNLKTEIPEESGMFAPLAESLGKIQEGFGKAVEEEVKSQRMKTELITNVSHDLKTPLTAIITYVDLLKGEQDPEKQKEYIEVLEKKSQRLKVLIEDLFEVSKASTDNVKLEIMDVDVVNLFKQVKLELEDKIQKAGLDFRCSYPEEKLNVRLDSQKTYRIFENLLVNIVKYALPHTRVYVEILREEDTAVIRMKNISEQELKVQGEELTERFVRGDSSRNTEGAGLGLAIVKSFVELQGGKFSIDIDGDLFKAEVRFQNLC